MNTDALTAFVESARAGSFSEVARQRRVSPSSISRQITQLEAELDTKLLQRNTRHLSLTEAGARYLADVAPLLTQLTTLNDAVRDRHPTLRGTLRITAPPSFGATRVAPALASFAATHPGVQIDLLLSERKLDLIKERLDIAIRQGPHRDAGLICRPLVRTRYRVCAAPDYLARHGIPDDTTALQQHRILSFGNGRHCEWLFHHGSGKVRAIALSSHMAMNSGIALREVALAGAGIALLSDWLVDQDIATGRLKRLFSHQTVTPRNFDPGMDMLYLPGPHLPRRVSACMHHLSEQMRGVANQHPTALE